MTHYDSTARVPFAKGGKVDKKPKPKRIILWKGKIKDWPGAQKAKERTGKQDGGNVSSKKTKGYRKRKKGDPQTKLDIYLKNKKIQSQNKKKYIEKHGEPEPRRKTLAVTDKYKKIRDSLGLKKGGKPWGSGPKPGTHEFLMQTIHRNKKAEGGRIGYAGGTGSDDETQTYQDNVKFLIEEIGLSPEQAHMMASIERDKKTGKADGGIMSLKQGGKVKSKKQKKWEDEFYQPDIHKPRPRPKPFDKKGEVGFKKGGKADKKWIQGVNKSIKARGTKGVCTGKKFGSASCKPGSRRYNLAKTFKKMARSKHASGGLVRYI